MHAAGTQLQVIVCSMLCRAWSLAHQPTPCPALSPSAGFLNSVATFIPAVAGVDLEGLVKQASLTVSQSKLGL